MKGLLTIFLFFSLAARATNYYVDNAGSNAAAGTSTATAWQTISKVNAQTFAAGDSIFFKRGGVWNEPLLLKSSGNSSSVIYVGAYGSGAIPEITGRQLVTGFTSVGNVWTATATNAAKSLNTVLVNGMVQGKARSAGGWISYTAISGNQISTALSGTPDYTGAEVVIRPADWIIDKATITAQSGGTLSFAPSMTYYPTFATGYFLQNHASLLDQVGEWCFDSTTKVLKVYATASPTVQVSTVDTLVYLKNKSYITFENIAFTGANVAAFQLDSSDHITVKNCVVKYSGRDAFSGMASNYVTIKGDSILYTFNDAIYLRQLDAYTPTVNTCNNVLVDSNYIKYTGWIEGMGGNGNGRYTTISVVGQNNQVTRNTVDSSGYIAVQFNGKNTLVKNNYVNSFCSIKSDGGGIYTVVGGYFPADYNDGSIIRGNIVKHYAGDNKDRYGIYLDDEAKNITVDSNTIINGYTAGLFLHNADSNTVRSNLFYNTDGPNVLFNTTHGTTLKDNVFYRTNASDVLLSLSGTMSSDSNYFSRPSNETSVISSSYGSQSLAAWTSASGFDFHSKITPLNITGAEPLLLINPTNADSTISLAGLYKDAKDNLYNNNVTLKPYRSALLYKASYELLKQKLINLKRYTLKSSN